MISEDRTLEGLLRVAAKSKIMKLNIYIWYYIIIYVYIYIWMPNIWTWESLQDFTFGHEFRFWISVTVSGLNIVLVTAGPPNKFKENDVRCRKGTSAKTQRCLFCPILQILSNSRSSCIPFKSHLMFLYFLCFLKRKTHVQNAVLRHVGTARNLLKANPTGWLNRWPQKM